MYPAAAGLFFPWSIPVPEASAGSDHVAAVIAQTAPNQRLRVSQQPL
jgi:hypothetical protein